MIIFPSYLWASVWKCGHMQVDRTHEAAKRVSEQVYRDGTCCQKGQCEFEIVMYAHSPLTLIKGEGKVIPMRSKT